MIEIMMKGVIFLTIGILIGMFAITILYSFYVTCKPVDYQFEENNVIYSEQATHITESTQKLTIDDPPPYHIAIQMPPDYAPSQV